MRFLVTLEISLDEAEARRLVNTGGVVLDTQEKALVALTMLAMPAVRPTLRELLLAPEATMPELGRTALLTTPASPVQLLLTIHEGDTPCPLSTPIKIPASGSKSKSNSPRKLSSRSALRRKAPSSKPQ